MPFPYYNSLSAAKKKTYRTSDAIERVALRHPGRIHSVTIALRQSLEDNRRRDVAKHASEICRLVCLDLGIETLAVKIKSRRPSRSDEELQGLYEQADGGTCVLTVWMKTAAKGRVVAFRSFIRTVLHELCHHIDYKYLNLDDSLHTGGFFRREASLYKQLVPVELRRKEPKKKKAPRKRINRQGSEEPEQMGLF